MSLDTSIKGVHYEGTLQCAYTKDEAQNPTYGFVATGTRTEGAAVERLDLRAFGKDELAASPNDELYLYGQCRAPAPGPTSDASDVLEDPGLVYADAELDPNDAMA